MGLGLTVAYNIIKNHGGELYACSQYRLFQFLHCWLRFGPQVLHQHTRLDLERRGELAHRGRVWRDSARLDVDDGRF